MPVSSTTPDRLSARDIAPIRIAFRQQNNVGAREEGSLRLNGWPMHSPVNASLMPSRATAHELGVDAVVGRGADYSTPPPQIPACNFPAPGSCGRSNAIVGLDATDPQARCFSVMLNPALSTEHVLQLTFPSTGRLPSVISAADFSRLCSMLHR